MKLVVDMNLSPRWANLLCEHGFEAFHWSALGAIRAPDEEIMAFAKANGFVVLTHDLDFGAILAASRATKPSVVQIRAHDISPDAIGIRLVKALHQATSELQQGALLTIDTDRNRIRMLPFG